MLVPAYSPEMGAAAVAAAKRGAPVAIIFNPADGPGVAADPPYEKMAGEARKVGAALYLPLPLSSIRLPAWWLVWW